jgi:hypothetical protein
LYTNDSVYTSDLLYTNDSVYTSDLLYSCLYVGLVYMGACLYVGLVYMGACLYGGLVYMGSLLIWGVCGYNTNYMHMEYMLSGTGWNIFTM